MHSTLILSLIFVCLLFSFVELLKKANNAGTAQMISNIMRKYNPTVVLISSVLYEHKSSNTNEKNMIECSYSISFDGFSFEKSFTQMFFWK